MIEFDYLIILTSTFDTIIVSLHSSKLAVIIMIIKDTSLCEAEFVFTITQGQCKPLFGSNLWNCLFLPNLVKTRIFFSKKQPAISKRSLWWSFLYLRVLWLSRFAQKKCSFMQNYQQGSPAFHDKCWKSIFNLTLSFRLQLWCAFLLK